MSKIKKLYIAPTLSVINNVYNNSYSLKKSKYIDSSASAYVPSVSKPYCDGYNGQTVRGDGKVKLRDMYATGPSISRCK